MTKMFLSLMLIFSSMIMFFMSHPLAMGLMILTQTLLICLLSGMLINTYWFSYILFLTFLGGLLVLFIYVSSIASNELFKLSFMNNFMFWMGIIIIIIMSIIFMYNLNWMNLSFNNYDMSYFFNYFIYFNNENNINLTKLYNKQTYFLMMMLIIYLFITLVAVVKITNIFYGPLRTMF